jgi:hypothetical protein
MNQGALCSTFQKAANVGTEHPVHALAHQRRMQRRESHMRVPSWSEAVGEVEEIDFVDSAEKLGDGTLNDLVLQSRHAERPLPAIGFRDVDTPNRLWPVTARVDARAEIPEVGLRSCSYAATVIPSTPALASRFCRRNARSSAAMSTWCSRAVNRVWAACWAAAFTRARLGGKATRLCVRTLASTREIPPGWSLPSARLVSFDGFIGTMNQSDSRPQLG